MCFVRAQAQPNGVRVTSGSTANLEGLTHPHNEIDRSAKREGGRPQLPAVSTT